MPAPSPTAQDDRANWLLFLALGGMWGSSYLFIKLGVETLTPLTLVAARLAFGAVLLIAVVAASREPLPRDPKIYGHLVVLACVSIVIPFFLITHAEQSVDSALAAVLTSTVPLFAIVIAALFLHDEPMTVNRLVGLAIGFVGVVLLVSGNVAGGSSDLGGEIALIGAAVSYGAGAVYARRTVRGLRPMIPAVFQVGFAFLISATLAVTLEHPFAVSWTPVAVGSVAWLGILGSGVAYLVNFRLLKEWGATRTTLVSYLLPVVGIALGVLVRGESIGAQVLAGTGLIVGGIALVNSRFGARRLFGRTPPVPPVVAP
jgi:drug/metabolite transporter (DMT)-like permease